MTLVIVDFPNILNRHSLMLPNCNEDVLLLPDNDTDFHLSTWLSIESANQTDPNLDLKTLSRVKRRDAIFSFLLAMKTQHCYGCQDALLHHGHHRVHQVVVVTLRRLRSRNSDGVCCQILGCCCCCCCYNLNRLWEKLATRWIHLTIHWRVSFFHGAFGDPYDQNGDCRRNTEILDCQCELHHGVLSLY